MKQAQDETTAKLKSEICDLFLRREQYQSNIMELKRAIDAINQELQRIVARLEEQQAQDKA